MRVVMWAILLAGLAATCLAGVPPQRPSVYGKVTDPTAAPVAGVEVTMRNVSTGEKQSALTDGGGYYEFSGVRDGEYRVIFRRVGFQRGEKPVSVRAALIPVKVDKQLKIAPTQSASGLDGSVEDEAGVPVAGATVTAVNTRTGGTRTTTTDEDGFYYLDVPEGSYQLHVVSSNFERYVSAEVSVVPAQLAGVDAVLTAGGVSATVNVVESGSVLAVEDPPLISTTLSSRVLNELPIRNDSLNALAALQPGVVPGRVMISANGSRTRANNFMIDGVENNDFGIAAAVADRTPTLPLASISEVTIGSPISTEFGRHSGGIVNIVTTGGGNVFHGAAFYSHRNSALGARDFFETSKSPSRAHLFGFNLGGPVVENRTFFFGSYEGNRDFEANPRLLSVPTRSRLSSASARLAAAGLAVNPLSVRLLQLFPPPGSEHDFHNLTVNSPAVRDSDSFNGRIDHSITDRSHTYARYYASRTQRLFPLAPSFFHGFRADYAEQEHALLVSLSSSFTNTRYNEASFSYGHNRERFSPEDRLFDPASVGLNTGVNAPERLGLPFIKITGFDALGTPPNLPGRETTTAWQLRDTFTEIVSITTLKFGAHFRRVSSDSENEAGTRGRIFFDGSVLGDPLADFLAGFPAGDTGILRGDTRREIALNYFGWFAHADVKLHSRLTLNAGLGYEFHGVPSERQDRLSNFVPELGGLVSVGSRALPKLYRNDLNNFAPRVGFAWSLTKDARAVVRGGWGIFYQAPRPALFSGVCPCANSIGQGVTTNPAGASRAFAVSPSVAEPFGPGLPVFGGEPGPASPLDIHAVERNLRTPLVHKLEAGLQYEVVNGTVLEIAYQGLLGSRLYRTSDINQPTPGDLRTRDARRPFFARSPQFRSINLLGSSARSSYHALHLSARRRLSNGLWFDAGYNFSKAMDDASGAAEIPQDSRDLRAERALSSFDRRHRFVFSWLYELPRFGPAALHGWSVSGIFRAESGSPFTPVISFDNSGTGTFVDRPELIDDPRLRGDRARLYDPAAFRLPPRGTFGGLGRNTIRGPASNVLDVALMKRTGLWGDSSLELRLDLFNALNRPNFQLPNPFVDDPAFGRANATELTGGRRRMQVGARLVF